MTNDRNAGHGDEHHVNPDHAATDPRAAAQQEQVKADKSALEDQSRRVEASVPAGVRDTPVQPSNAAGQATEDTAQSVRNTDLAHINAEASRESARRVQDSVDHDRDTRKENG